jgi:hypothetical protein
MAPFVQPRETRRYIIAGLEVDEKIYLDYWIWRMDKPFQSTPDADRFRFGVGRQRLAKRNS